jgi:phage shock protein PspC (stress-responsive transcriptional regulator)
MSDNNGLEPKAPVARTESVGSLDFHPSSKEEHKKSRASLNNQQMEDSGEVKFSKDSVEGKGDAAVEIGAVPQPFAGMGKDELMKYANDPFWVRLRWALFILFWLAWLGMLAAAIAIIIMAPKCPAPTPLEYWQEAPVYHVLPRTFEKSPSGLKGNQKKKLYP